MLWILLIFGTIILDRVSKMMILKNIEFADSIKVIENFFYITSWENKGAAWGAFQGGRYFFIAITSIVCIVLAVMLYKSKSRLLSWGLSLIIGGAIGNLIDRVYRGSVTDFFQFYIFKYEFPIFNFADIFVVIGTAVFSIYLLFYYEEKPKSVS